MHRGVWRLAEDEGEGEEEDWSYRISNGAGMKRFLIFRLAAFQWAGALHGAQALIPAPGSIIGVSSRSPRPRKPTETAAVFCFFLSLPALRQFG